MYKFAINRPVSTFMFAMAMILFGLYAINMMPKALFPDVDFPVVVVKTTYKGASAETIETKVTDKIEQAVLAIDGLKYVTSNSAKNVSLVVAQFDLEKPIETAVNDVRDKVSAVVLDSEIDKPTVQKLDTGSTPIVSLFVSSNKPVPEMMKHINNVITPILQRISGVGNVKLNGYRERQVKVYPDQTLMNKYGITYTDLAGILGKENREIDGGRVLDSKSEHYIVTDANSMSVEQVGDIIIKDGLKLKDVAEIDDGLAEEKSYSTLNGKYGVILEVQKITGANEIAISKGVKEALQQINSVSPGFEVEIFWDTTDYIQSSIKDIQFDLALGGLLAVSIVFLFLRNVTITIVSAICLPVSVLGTFMLIHMMGFTLNMLTMLALTLAIGIIIDDAIVVIENIHKKLEHGMKPREAAYEGVREIGFAIVAISAMLLSVFVPVGTMSGISGKFFASFGLTVALAVGLSYIVVISVVPMFSSILLKAEQSAFYYKTKPFFDKLDSIYLHTIKFLMKSWFNMIIVAAAVFGIFMLSLVVASTMGNEFLLKEDRSEFEIMFKGKPGISITEMKHRTEAFAKQVEKNPNVKFVALQVGPGDLQQAFFSELYVRLKPIKDRSGSGRERDQFVILDKILSELRNMPEAKGLDVFGSEVPLVGGGSDNTPVQLAVFSPVESIMQNSVEKLSKYINEVEPKFKDKITNFHLSTSDSMPAFKLIPIRQNVAQYGITSTDIGQAISMAFSGETQVAYYKEAGKEYYITVRAPDDKRISLEDIKKVQVRSSAGNLIFIDGLVDIEDSFTSTNITRFNRQRSITVAVEPKEHSGLSVGEMVQLIEKNANEGAKWLESGAGYRLMGQADNLSETLLAFGIAIGMAFILIYLILAALYESFLQPIIIMVTMPLSFSGAFFAIKLVGGSSAAMSMFSIMGLILLIGMVGKNATLLVDVANEKLKEGVSITEAIQFAGESRLRPILMTTIAMVAGMLPLALATGDGSAMKQPIGLAMIGGLLVSMMLSLLVVPIFYRIITPIDLKLQRFYKPKKEDEI
ncbi:MMPL family transporter [Helicobacter saguini]|uniref:AcrB/AcrD/AcrF family protein n=1 Tax=Helicobacter saguini TaxID=1548018 RepID=A0A347VSM4_9HELI|nr:efflux RND transporter permease subunit [Helicobacter saguini]MWV62440.1 MMPL family transporter [Helicobacter saguini]MWV66888.1 MMPL family transporter [Helicobacter saguini]MWV69236.1 MMPL family transporter [Helicobacter saguini]MWV71208.1 MMPL family transporter [Helicobacter saguini]TLD93316.1 AcrB/AcrD/AcrF family protein [Helicobacter saguini]